MKISVREAQILELLQRGLTNKEIGQDLTISPHTVRDHISGMLTRFDLKGRTALAALHARKSTARQGAMASERRTSCDRRAPVVAVDPTDVALHL